MHKARQKMSRNGRKHNIGFIQKIISGPNQIDLSKSWSQSSILVLCLLLPRKNPQAETPLAHNHEYIYIAALTGIAWLYIGHINFNVLEEIN